MKVLKRQNNISMYRSEPSNETHKTSQAVTVLPESPTFQYYVGGVLTPDAGTPAGTAVMFFTTFDNIKNASGNLMATEKDTSLTFTGTAFTTEKMWPWDDAEARDDVDGESRLKAVTYFLKPGEYCVDYVEGIGYGIKADNSTGLTGLTYIVRQPAANGTFVLPPTIDLTAFGGVAVSLGQKTMAASIPTVIASDQSPLQTLEQTGLIPKVYDYISMTYTGTNLTGVVYKTGGAGGAVVATLTITYSGSNITSVTRT